MTTTLLRKVGQWSMVAVFLTVAAACSPGYETEEEVEGPGVYEEEVEGEGLGVEEEGLGVEEEGLGVEEEGTGVEGGAGVED